MTTAKVNNQYDYITLRIKFDDKQTLNVTRSRRGISLSGTAATKSALEFLDAWFLSRKGSTIGESMTYLQDRAIHSDTMGAFIKII